MKWFLLVLPLLAAEAAEPVDRMREAETAYKANDYAKAQALYADLIKEGHVAPELFFNAGNTAFRLSDVGTAILHYRRAWYLAPRDNDISANLAYALEQAGVSTEALTPVERVFARLTMAEWAALGMAAFWVGAIAFGVSFFRQRAVPWRRIALSLLPVLAVALAGIGFWADWRQRSEWVVLKPGQKALFAPIDSATAHFEMPPGTIVRGLERSGDWLQIQSGKEKGWIRTSSCAPVLPWKSDASL